MRFGLDSTDSRTGGCTTHVAAHILARLNRFAVRVAPRLVRLNPNIPYKTRGNGALSFDLGHARGPTRVIGEVDGKEIRAADDIAPLSATEQRNAFETASEVVQALRSRESGSALVAFATAPDPTLYWAAVRQHVEAPPEPPPLRRTWGDGRGLIGATAAAAWPGLRGTWEAIAYRAPARVGTPRALDPLLGAALDASLHNTFDNWDPRHEHLRIAPASPCPILAGVRATDEMSAMAALQQLGPEGADAWMLFWTNQATGDHLRPGTINTLRPFDSIRLRALVRAEARTTGGGHVFVDLRDETGHLTAAAYEPTKEFRDVVRRLRAGDLVEVEGSVHEDTRILALEALTMQAPSPLISVDPPRCERCDRPMKSGGRRTPYRCRPCGNTAAALVSTRPRQVLEKGRITVPASVRRHLSAPNHLHAQPLSPTHTVIA